MLKARTLVNIVGKQKEKHLQAATFVFFINRCLAQPREKEALLLLNVVYVQAMLFVFSPFSSEMNN